MRRLRHRAFVGGGVATYGGFAREARRQAALGVST